MRRILSAFNSIFFTNIPKNDNPSSFKAYKPISLCNNTYQIIVEVRESRLEPILSEVVSQEQFSFLEGTLIHDIAKVL